MLQTKKINYWLPLVCVAVMGLTACEPKPDVPEPEPPYDGEYVELNYLSFYKTNDEEGNELVGFGIDLNQEGMFNENGVLVKKGNLYEMRIYSTSFDFYEGYRVPKEGEYEIGEYVAGKNNRWGQVVAYKNTSGNADFKTFVSGKLTVKKIENGYRIDVNIVDDKGAEHKVRYEGTLKSHNNSEPDEATTVNLSLNENDIFYHHNFGNSGGLDYVGFTFNNQNFHFLLQIWVPSGSTSIPSGTYPISEDYYWLPEVKTVWRATYSVWNEEGYMAWGYTLVSGTMVVSDNGFVINAVSRNGSTINATYTGSLDLIRW